jgi:hypothetical protein
MKIRFRYHTYLNNKKVGTAYDGCRYCQDKLLSIDGKLIANRNENEWSKRLGVCSNADGKLSKYDSLDAYA